MSAIPADEAAAAPAPEAIRAVVEDAVVALATGMECSMAPVCRVGIRESERDLRLSSDG